MIDRIGKRYNYFTIIKRIESGKGNRTRYLCKCDCGNEFVLEWRSEKYNKSSCGCMTQKVKSMKSKFHGESYGELYNHYRAMKERCYGTYNKAYKYYGGRGIIVCDEWKNDFLKFKEWSMQNGYSDNKKLEIDRINNDGNYSPDNCRWVGKEKNMNNKRNSVLISYEGYTLSVAEWSRFVDDLSYGTILKRYHDGWNPQKIFNTPSTKMWRKPKIHFDLICEYCLKNI